MFLTLKKWTILYILSLLLVFFSFTAVMLHAESIHTSGVTLLTDSAFVLIIDPGHGGEDGGAVAGDGTVESQINLALAQKTYELAKLLGWEVCLTRDEDISIHDSNANTLREKKVSDLKNRVKLCNEVKNGILISIHQNSLPEHPTVRGAQAFYNGTENGRLLASVIQSVMNKELNGGRSKESKRIEGNYLMSHVSSPAVLIECGFLSNPDETKLLKTDEYQLQISVSILKGLLEYLKIEQNISG